MEVLKDIAFKKCFGVMGGVNGDREVTYDIQTLLKTENMSDDFCWRISQWATRRPFQKECNVVKSNEFVKYENVAKRVIVYNDEKMIELDAFASQEYEKPRVSGESWIHLLLEQVLDVKDKIPFQIMKELYFHVEFCVEQCDNKMEEDTYNKDIHAAQAVWYITVENPLSKDLSPEGRPDYLWFGVPLFDNRGLNFNDNYHLDFGTKKLIYSMGANNFYQENPHVGKWYTLDYNVLPIIKKAYNLAMNNNFLPGSSFENMVIGSTNIGWEIPGTFDCKIKIKNISINYR